MSVCVCVLKEKLPREKALELVYERSLCSKIFWPRKFFSFHRRHSWLPNLRFRSASSVFRFYRKVTVERRRRPKGSASVLQRHMKAPSGAVFIDQSQLHHLHLLGWNAPTTISYPLVYVSLSIHWFVSMLLVLMFIHQ